MWHTQDRQGQILALPFSKSPDFFEGVLSSLVSDLRNFGSVSRHQTRTGPSDQRSVPIDSNHLNLNLRILVYWVIFLTLGGCPVNTFCCRGTPPTNPASFTPEQLAPEQIATNPESTNPEQLAPDLGLRTTSQKYEAVPRRSRL